MKEGQHVFEYERKRYFKKGTNPGVGKCIGIIQDAVSRTSECFVRFVDQVAGEWVETRYIRKAPSPGYILFTDTFTGQRTQFKLVEYTVGGAVLTFGAGTADGKEDSNAKEHANKEDGKEDGKENGTANEDSDAKRERWQRGWHGKRE